MGKRFIINKSDNLHNTFKHALAILYGRDVNCSNCQKKSNFLKKSVDSQEKVWYSNIAVGNGSEITKEKIKKWKKLLTKQKSCDKI